MSGTRPTRGTRSNSIRNPCRALAAAPGARMQSKQNPGVIATFRLEIVAWTVGLRLQPKHFSMKLTKVRRQLVRVRIKLAGRE